VLKKVIESKKEILMDFAKNHIEGPNTYPKWDKAKCLMHNYAIMAWEEKVRIRGPNLKRHTIFARDLHMLPLTWPWRSTIADSLEKCARALHIATAKGYSCLQGSHGIQMDPDGRQTQQGLFG
jgi:hypothetical protein